MGFTITGGVSISGGVSLLPPGGSPSPTPSGVSNGYATGGNTPLGSSDTIFQFPFSSDSNATDVGNLSESRYGGAGQSSTENGYTSGGGFPAVSTVDKFPFVSNGNATDVGDLTLARMYVTGQSSDQFGYSSGGFNSPGQRWNNIIDKFPFSSDSPGSCRRTMRCSASCSTTTPS